MTSDVLDVLGQGEAGSAKDSSVQLLSHVRLFVTPRTAAHQACLSITNSQSLPKLMSIELVMPPNHLILCHPLHLLPHIPPSISLFQWVNSLHQVAKVLEFQLQHQSFRWTPRTDLLLNHSSKALILRCSAFFIVQLSHPYMTIGKTIALTRWTFAKRI